MGGQVLKLSYPNLLNGFTLHFWFHFFLMFVACYARYLIHCYYSARLKIKPLTLSSSRILMVVWITQRSTYIYITYAKHVIIRSCSALRYVYPTKNIIYTESQNIALRHLGHLDFRGCTHKRCSPVAVYPTQNIIFMQYPKLALWGRGQGVPGATGHFWGIWCVNIIFSEVHNNRRKTFGGSYMERQRQRNTNVTLYVRIMFSVFRARYGDITPV